MGGGFLRKRAEFECQAAAATSDIMSISWLIPAVGFWLAWTLEPTALAPGYSAETVTWCDIAPGKSESGRRTDAWNSRPTTFGKPFASV